MSTRRSIIIVLIALVLVAVVALFAFVFSPGGGGTESGGEGRQGLFGSLFPFNFGQGPGNGGTAPRDEEALPDTRPVPQLRKVSDAPTAGGMFFDEEDETITIRYVERATGHVYETKTDSLTVQRVSNTTIPGIQEVLWGDKNSFVIRYIDDDETVKTFYATLSKTETENEQALTGSFLGSWNRATLDQKREAVFSIEETSTGSVFSLAELDGSKKRTVYTSPIRSWIPLQSNDDLFLQTAPSPSVDGYLYRLNGQSLVRVVGAERGLLALVSGDGRYILGSGNDAQGTLETFIVDTKTNERLSSPVATLATKCVFLNNGPRVVCGVPDEIPQGEYPNDWLLGKVSFSDDVWLIDPVGGVAELVSIPVDDADTPVDITRPAINDTGTYFGFINKNDLSFWALRLPE